MGAVQLISIGLPLISLPYLATVLGAEQLGRMAFALSVGQILIILTDYGFNLSAPKAIATNQENRQRIAEIWCAVTTIRISLALAGLGIVFFASFISKRAHDELPLFLIAFTMVIGNIVFPQWLFLGLEKLKVVSAAQVVGRLIVFLPIFILIKDEGDVYWATFLQAAGFLVSGLLTLPYTIKELTGGRVSLPKHEEIKEQLKEGWHVFISTAAINIYTTSNAFFLGLFANPVTVGQYHVAEKIIRAAQALYGPVGNAIYPHITRLAATSRSEALKFIRLTLLRLTSIAIIVSALIFISAPYAVTLIFGSEYVLAATILQILALMLPFSITSNILAIQTMIPFGLEEKLSRVLLGAALFDFATFIPASYFFGSVGAAWANLGVELFVTAASLTFLRINGINPMSLKFK